MKVAICVHSVRIGGNGTFVVNLGRSLAALGHDVTVYAHEPGARWSRVAETGLNGACLSQHQWESKAAFVGRTTALFSRAGYDALLLVIDKPFPAVRMALPQLPDSLAVVPMLRSDHPSIYERASSSAAWWNVAVAISPRVQQTAAARIPAKPVIWLATGVELPSAAKLESRLPWSSPLRLLYVGRLHGVKNVLFLPAILHGCESLGLDVQLTVTGDGEDRGPLERAFAEAGVAERVSMRGFLAPDDVFREMRAHHVLLLTSTSEGLANVLLESQANGCVPVASRLPGVTDVAIAEGVTGLLAEVGNAQSFAGQIAALTGSDRWQRYSVAAAERARREFSRDEMGRQYAGLLEELRSGAYALPTPRSRLPAGRPRFSRSDHLPLALVPIVRRLRRRLPRMST